MDTKRQAPKVKRLRNDGLIEALRGLGTGTAKSVTNDLLTPLPDDLFRQTGLRPQRNFDKPAPAEMSYFEEKEEFWRKRLGRSDAVRHEEKLVFVAKERETKVQIGTLLEEVKKLATAVQKVEKEVEITAFQAPVEPGVYHVSFFQKIISFLRSLTQKIEDSAHWMAAFNSKAKKRSYYWGQVQKSGTKFMLSQERYMATQVG